MSQQEHSDKRSVHVALGWTSRGPDGPSFGYEHAKVCCERCDGFEGTECPRSDCTVRLVSTQMAHDERYRQEMAEHERERRKWRANMRARRAER